MSHIRLIISDIDGTILNDHHQIDPQLASLIPDLKREKIPFVLASARSPKGMAPIAKELGIEDCPMACYNGALIQKGEQVLFEHPLNKNEARQFINWVNQHFPQVSINLYSGKDWMTDHLDQWSQEEARITGEKPIILPLLDPLLDATKPLHKLLLIGEAEEIQALYRAISTDDLPSTAFYLSKANYLEVTAKQVSKEDALVELANHYHLCLEEVLTMGDNFNDLPMLKKAGIGVAMGNAPQEVKDGATVVTKTNNENGAGQAVEIYVLI